MRGRIIWIVVLAGLAAAACNRKNPLFLVPGKKEEPTRATTPPPGRPQPPPQAAPRTPPTGPRSSAR